MILFHARYNKNAIMKKLTDRQKEVSRRIQQDMGIEPYPFQAIAHECRLTSTEVLSIIRQLIDKKIIRRFGAILGHRKAGLTQNALVVWSVPEPIMEKTGKALAAFPFVSHCYERKPAFQGKYNCFTMIHSPSGEISSLIKTVSEATGIADYLILESVEEYKKTSPEYF